MSTIKLNAEKRIQIGNEFEAFYRNKDSKAKKEWLGAIKNFDEHKNKIHNLCNQIVRKHQPQEDVDTIKRMISKYGNNGGDIFNDHCFYFETPTINDDGEADTKSMNVNFGLTRDFACSYFDKALRASGKDPDYDNKWDREKRNPSYYQAENEIEKYFGWRSESNGSGKQNSTIKDDWDNGYNIEVIGTSYCGERRFKVDSETFEVLNQFVIMQEKVVDTHKRLFDYIESKMSHIRKALKNYRTFNQAKELADEVGMVLNETILETGSSMALSIYNPKALASLLADNDEEDNKADIIAQFKLGKLNQAVN
jgi:hypothetical protein